MLLCRPRGSAQAGPFELHFDHTASAVAFLGLLVQWSCRGRAQAWTDSVQGVFQALCGRALGQESFAAELSLDRAARCCPGLFAEGRDRAELEVANGVVDLRALQQVAVDFPLADDILAAIRRSCHEVPSGLPLWRLLLVGFESGKRHLWWYRQFLVIGALAFDNFLPTLGLPTDPITADVRVVKRKRRDPALVETQYRTLARVMASLSPWAAPTVCEDGGLPKR